MIAVHPCQSSAAKFLFCLNSFGELKPLPSSFFVFQIGSGFGKSANVSTRTLRLPSTGGRVAVVKIISTEWGGLLTHYYIVREGQAVICESTQRTGRKVTNSDGGPWRTRGEMEGGC